MRVYPNWKMNFNSKNGRRRCFSLETNAIISYIPIKRMCLWCLIMIGRENIIWICVCPNRRMNINSKNGRKKCFSYETKARMPFIPMRRMWFWCVIMKEKRLLCEFIFAQIDEWTLILKMTESEVFLMNPNHQFIYPNKEMNLWCPIIKGKEIIMRIRICLIQKRTSILKW